MSLLSRANAAATPPPDEDLVELAEEITEPAAAGPAAPASGESGSLFRKASAFIGRAAADCGEAQSIQELAPASALFTKNPFPVLIVDTDLRIEFANEACDRLFSNLYHLRSSRFTDLFGRALGQTALRELHQAVKSSARGYSWKGLIKSKARSASTVLTKTYLFPIYTTAGQAPSAFVVMFDDVTEENKALLRSVFLSLLEASKLKDNDTGQHIERVNAYAKMMTEFLFDKPGYEEIDRDFIDDIAFLAAMHDVGKIGTPDDILNKEGPLADWEWTIMQEHTKNGAYILSTYPNPMAREIALNHHERWDGTGYPFKLEGTMIPLAARIVSIADVYDALRSKRSYKPAYTHVQSIEKILDWRGSHFDPALVEVVQQIHPQFEAYYSKHAD
jgi:putative two-component system response regulator